METAYAFLRTDAVEKQDELILWIYLHIRGVPNNVFRFEQYCRDLVGKFRALPETHYPLAFVLWCKTMCTRVTVDDGQTTANYDILTSILNATSDILHLPQAHLIRADANFPVALGAYLKTIADQHKGRNGLLANDFIAEIRLRTVEHAQAQRTFMSTIRGELLEKAWHPSRVMRLMEMGIEPEDM
jgi:hypothetical protein